MVCRPIPSTGPLRGRAVAKPLRLCDHGAPWVMDAKEMERFCEVVAAIKIRTSKK
jgi:hypothetical protein